jgi:hypothetical protein
LSSHTHHYTRRACHAPSEAQEWPIPGLGPLPLSLRPGGRDGLSEKRTRCRIAVPDVVDAQDTGGHRSLSPPAERAPESRPALAAAEALRRAAAPCPKRPRAPPTRGRNFLCHDHSARRGSARRARHEATAAPEACTSHRMFVSLSSVGVTPPMGSAHVSARRQFGCRRRGGAPIKAKSGDQQVCVLGRAPEPAGRGGGGRRVRRKACDASPA